MILSYEALDACMEDIVENTKIEDFLLLLTNGNLDEKTGTRIVSTILESIIVEKLSLYQYKKICSEYGELGEIVADRNKANAEKRARNKREKFSHEDEFDKIGLSYDIGRYKKIKKKLESSFSVGMTGFFEVFDEFEPKGSYLLPQLRRCFKNYKFKLNSIVNDYTMLYFAFKLFEILLDELTEETVGTEARRLAEIVAEACFKVLHNPHKRRRVRVTGDTLLSFIKQFVLGDPRIAYTYCLTYYIQAVYDSKKLPDYIRYDIFERFSKHIIFINVYLRISKEGKKVHAIPVEKPKDRLKVNKYIANKVQKFKEDDALEGCIAILKELQKNINWLNKNILNSDFISKKKIYTCCSTIYDALKLLAELTKDKGKEKEVYDILEQYTSLTVDFGDKQLSLIDVLTIYIEMEDTEGVRMRLPRCKLGNPYIYLLLSSYFSCDYNVDSSFEIQKQYSEVIEEIRTIVDNRLTIESVKQYEQVINYVHLDELRIPILYTNPDNHHFRAMLKYIISYL